MNSLRGNMRQGEVGLLCESSKAGPLGEDSSVLGKAGDLADLAQPEQELQGISGKLYMESIWK